MASEHVQLNAVEITMTRNGFIVRPSRIGEDPRMQMISEVRVYRNFNEMSNFLKRAMIPEDQRAESQKSREHTASLKASPCKVDKP